MHADAEEKRDAAGDLIGYSFSVYVERGWTKTKIDGAQMSGSVVYGGVWLMGFRTISGHLKLEKAKIPSVVLSQLSKVTDVMTNGEVHMIPDGQGGRVVETTSAGDPVFVTPPTPMLRFTSSATPSGAQITYAYTVENLTSEARTFSLPQVTTPAFQAGWSGTLSAWGSDSLAFAGNSASGACLQTTECETRRPNGSDLHAIPGDMYCPPERLAFDGVCESIGVTHQGSGNSVAFRVDGQSAAGFYLFAVTAQGLEEVASSYAPIPAGVVVTALDPNGQTPKTYRVLVGVGCNGSMSAPITGGGQ